MLFRKMLRDMGRHRTQFISIFIMAFLGVFIYAGIGAEWMGLDKTVTSYYRETNMADIWLYGSGFSQEDEQAVSNLPGVTGTERELVVDGIGKLDSNPAVSLHFVEENHISKIHTVSGDPFSMDRDGIWLDHRFAQAHRLAVGDTLTVDYNGLSIEKTLLGTVYNPEYIYLSDGNGMTPDFAANGYGYISARYFPMPAGIVYNRMLITTGGEDSNTLEEPIHSALNGNYSVFLTRENNESHTMFRQEIDQHRAIGSIFPIAFLAIALLTILTTITRMVVSQRTQIGTLKAMGFAKSKILVHYISYSFWISLAGSLFGAVIGPMVLPYLFYPSLSGFYTLPSWEPASDFSFFAMAMLTAVLCTLVAWLSCKSLLSDTPAETLRPKAPKIHRHGLLEKTALWHKLGFNMQWNLRDMLRSKSRSIMAVIGVTGCTALLVCAFGMNDSMKGLKDWQYTDINHFRTWMTVDETATEEQLQTALQQTDGEAVMESAVEIKANGVKKTGALTATDHVTLLRFTDEKRNRISLPEGGVSLSYKMAKMLGVKKGDSILWHIFGEERWVTTQVSEIYRSPASQGITLTREALENLGYDFTVTAILAPETVSEQPPGIASIQQNEDLIKGWDDLTEAMMTMVYLLISAAVVLAVVVLYNLGILSFNEKERDLATLKVVGFKSKPLQRLLLTQNLILSAIGFILGVPAGKWLIDVMIATMGESFDMITTILPLNIILSFVMIFVLSVGVNQLFSGKIRRLDMVGSLKGVE